MNVELRLLAVMLKTGDFGPLMREEITKEHFETTEGQTLHLFITSYREESDGVAKYPSLAIVRHRFKSSMELADPDPGDKVENLSHELRVTKLKSDLRQFAVQADEVANGPLDPIIAITPVITKLRKALEKQQRINHISLRDGLTPAFTDYKAGNLLPDGVAWPWPLLTKETKGLHRKEFIVIAGRPKSRKTFTALRIGVNAVREHNQRLLIFSPEMPVRQVFLRCIAHLADLPYREFKDGALEPADEARLEGVVGTYGKLEGMDDEAYAYQLIDAIPNLGETFPSIDVVQSTGRDTNWMAAQIELYRPTIVIADSFYRQRAPGAKRNDIDHKAVTALSREMKDLCMDANIIMLGTHQLNRGAEKSVGDLSNLALADAVGADADGIYRVVTGKIGGEDVSALLNLGGREVSYDGILIKNKPCYDYSEVGAIQSRRQVADLMKQEEEAIDAEETENLRERASGVPQGPRRAQASGRSATGSAPRHPKHKPKPFNPGALNAHLTAQVEEEEG